MFKQFALIVLILASVQAGMAVEGPDGAVNVQLDQSNRFLSAETSRIIKDEMAQVEESLKSYQDENFVALDGEMRKVMVDVQQRVILGSLGAMLLGGAIVAIIMFNLAKKYSYEKVLEQQAEHLQQQNDLYNDPHMQQLQNPDWGTQQYGNTVSSDFGQSFASNASQFSGWQQNAPYKGGWEWDGK